MTTTSPVKARGAGYGLDAELAQKAADKYDPQLELEARKWIEAIIHEKLAADFGMGLKDGIALCKVVNAVEPGVVRKIETSSMPFKQMENVSNFLKACRKLGVMEHDLFETVDLYELKDLGLVVRCLHALGRAIQKNYPQFQGPKLGVKESTMNKRSFSEKQLAQEHSVASKLSMGSSKTMERVEINTSSSVTFGHESAVTPPKRTPPPPPPAPRQTAPSEKSPPATELKVDTSTSTTRSTRRSPGERSTSRSPSKSPVQARGGGYGLDAELAQRAADRYDYDAEEEAQEWIEDILDEDFPTNFADSLKDGVILCRLINTIQPGSVRKIETSKMPFKQMENISNFLKACRTVGVMEFDLFETVDLFEQKDIGVVVRCLHALGRAVQKNCPHFNGPKLGVKEATKNRRNFSPEKMKQASSAVSKWSLGSSQTMERTEIEKSSSITFGIDHVGEAHPSSLNAIPKVHQPANIDRAVVDRSVDITFGHDSAKM